MAPSLWDSQSPSARVALDWAPTFPRFGAMPKIPGRGLGGIGNLIPGSHSPIPSSHSPIPTFPAFIPTFLHSQLPFPGPIPSFPAPIPTIPAPIPLFLHSQPTFPHSQLQFPHSLIPSPHSRIPSSHSQLPIPRFLGNAAILGASGSGARSARPRPGPLWIPLETPRSLLEQTSGSTTDPGAKNSSGSLSARSFHPEFLRDLPGSGCSAPDPGFGIIPGGASAAPPGDSRRKSGASRGRSGAPGRIPMGKAALLAEFQWGKRSWQNSRQHSWQNSLLEQQGRAGSGSSGVKIPGSEPGLREGTIPGFQFKFQPPGEGGISWSGNLMERDFHGERISWRGNFVEREFY